jgi:hypothetical protein
MKNHSSRLAFAIATGLACGPAFAANTIDFPDFISQANYPAHVRAIHFSNCTIDATHSCVWGAWTVSFGAQPPVATYSDPGQIPQVGVSSLTCTNAIEGSSACGADYSRPSCAQTLNSHTAPIFIDCPESIELTP